MNMSHVVKLNNRTHEVRRSGDVLILGYGKGYALYHCKSQHLVSKHALTGKFRTEVAK